MNIYVASSWRNYLQAGIVTMLRKIGHEVYDFRHPAPDNDGFHWEAIDPELGKLDKWPPARWREVVQHPIAVAGYELDMGALKRCDACVGVLPFGRSASFEVGWAMGAGKRCYIIAFDDTEPELMFRECMILTEMDELFEAFGEPGKPRDWTPASWYVDPSNRTGTAR